MSAMGFGKQAAVPRVSAGRLAALAGGGAVQPVSAPGGEASSAPKRRVSVEPDLSRINRNRIIETPEARKRRLAAKTMNFGATFIARTVIFAAAGFYGYELYQQTGDIHRGVAVGMLAMAADFGRVMLKAMEPGSK